MTEAQKLSITKAQEVANAQRDEAKLMLCSAIGLPENIGSGAINLAVDCIISAAILEVRILMQQEVEEAAPRNKYPDLSTEGEN